MSDGEQTHGDPKASIAQAQTGLAAFRTALALDRTTLAWIRTSLAMASFGLGMVGFFRSLREKDPTAESLRLHEAAIRFGTGLVAVGVCAMVLAALSHWLTLRRLRRRDTLMLPRWPLAITLALLLAVAFLAGLWDLLKR
jgi:putative membrane protein